MERAPQPCCLHPKLIMRTGGQLLKQGSWGIARDSRSGNLAVVSVTKRKVGVYSAWGIFLRATRSQLLEMPIAVEFYKGELMVSDYQAHQLVVLNAAGDVRLSLGSTGDKAGEFRSPRGVCVDNNERILVVDQSNARVQVFSLQGEFLFMFGSRGSGPGQFNDPSYVACEPKTGNILVSDCRNNRIQKFDPQGNYLAQIGQAGTSDGQFASPLGLAFDCVGNLAVADQSNNRVQIFAPNGNYLSQFSVLSPEDLVIDDLGNFVITSQNGGVHIYGDIPCGLLEDEPPFEPAVHVKPLSPVLFTPISRPKEEKVLPASVPLPV